MGQLKVVSVSGWTFHSACHFDFADVKYEDCWRGFGPVTALTARGPGMVYTKDESGRVNHGVVFEVPDSVLLSALTTICEKYRDAPYRLGFNDCVSFSVDVARACGLTVPPTNITPYGLLDTLRSRNRAVSSW